MFASKIVLIAVCCEISFAAVVTEDGDCAALPKKEVSLGEHAMLQLSEKKSKPAAMPHVLTESEIDNWASSSTQTATETGVETAGSTVNQQATTLSADQGTQDVTEAATPAQMSSTETQYVAAATTPTKSSTATGATTLSQPAVQESEDLSAATTLAKSSAQEAQYVTEAATLTNVATQETEDARAATTLTKSSAQEAEDATEATTLTKSSAQETEYVPATLTKSSPQEAEDATEAATFSKMSAKETEAEDSIEATTLSKMPAQDQEKAAYTSGSQSDEAISEKAVSSSSSQYVVTQKEPTERSNLVSESETESTDSTSSQTSGNLMKMQHGSEEPADEQACDWECYLDRYPDLVSVVGLDVAAAEQHWENSGKSEGRDCSCDGASMAEEIEDGTEEKEEAADTSSSTGNQFNSIQDSSATAASSTDALTSDKHMLTTAKGSANEVTSDQNATSVSSIDALTSDQNTLATAKDSANELSSDQNATVVSSTDALTSDQNMIATAKDSANELTSDQNMVATARDSATAVAGSELTSGKDSAAVAYDSAAGATEASMDSDAKEGFKESVMDLATRCQPISEANLAALKAEIKSNEEGDKFKEKILEAKGESPASAGHVSIMKYLRDKVLEPGWSILELGAGAGGMLRFVKDEYENSIGAFNSLVGIDLVPGWVKFAQEYFTDIHMYEGDITEFALPEPYAGKTFNFTMLNDVMEHVQSSRYGCFFSQLDRVTHPGSVVYMHTPSPLAQLEDKKQADAEDKVFLQNVVPESFVSTAMAMHGFELVAFEHDMDTICGGEGHDIPRQLRGARCYHNGWPKYTHNVYRKAASDAVLRVS